MQETKQEQPKEEVIESLETPQPVTEKKIEQVALFDLQSAPYQANTYKPSPVISPIYGIEKEKALSQTSIELENTANYEKLDEEIRKTNEFLSKLRELQKNLD